MPRSSSIALFPLERSMLGCSGALEPRRRRAPNTFPLGVVGASMIMRSQFGGVAVRWDSDTKRNADFVFEDLCFLTSTSPSRLCIAAPGVRQTRVKLEVHTAWVRTTGSSPPSMGEIAIASFITLVWRKAPLVLELLCVDDKVLLSKMPLICLSHDDGLGDCLGEDNFVVTACE